MGRIRTVGLAVVIAAGLALGSTGVAAAAPPGCTLQGKAQMLCKDPSKQPKHHPEKGPDWIDIGECVAGIAGNPLGGATWCLFDAARHH